jgi:hypothetical protein
MYALVPTLGQMNQAHIDPSYFFKARVNIILPSTLRFSKGFLSFTFSHQNFVRILSANSTCPAHLILLDMITLAKAGEENN